MLTIDQFVQREVVQCVSDVVSTLAKGCGGRASNDMRDLCEQAFELACPIDDWEEAARGEGWSLSKHPVGKHFVDTYGNYHDVLSPDCDSWEELCDAEGIEPYAREVYEHWAVTPWLAERLIAQGEKVDLDFAGMCVWARTTTGQQISADYVIGEIYRDLMAS